VCGLAISELLTDARLHGSHRTARLCWTCHRAYDIDVLTTEEVLAADHRAVTAWERYMREVTHTAASTSTGLNDGTEDIIRYRCNRVL
jgi:hypothetical protein